MLKAAPAHPYLDLPERAYWRTAVAERAPLDISGLYTRRFDLAPGARIASLGSCFAQHIGRRMAAKGFAYMNMEPAPRSLPEARRQALGYDMFSVRSGNIYTARQLLQLLRRSEARFEPQESVWRRGGRWFDPFRPTIEEGGFGSADEVAALRRSHLAAARRMFRTVDVLIFTLGLTEAWGDARDGAVYPVCPGVSAGEFDSDRHRFHNFRFGEILEDMEAFIAELRAENPGVKLLLTVSPVPLTATASGDHVAVATLRSKSILRAVASELYDRHDFIDYFPSYEVISSTAFEARFFEANKRSVRPEGVDFVMSHFFGEHVPPEAPAKRARKERLSKFEALCDEEALDQGGRT